MIRLTGYLLVVKPGSRESCNCYLTKDEADNHLVLVTSTTVNKYKLPPKAKAKDFNRVIKLREPESITVEFTPRVRKDHPNFTLKSVEPLFRKTAQGALLVRVTGLLMFDSEHWKKLHVIVPAFRFCRYEIASSKSEVSICGSSIRNGNGPAQNFVYLCFGMNRTYHSCDAVA